MLFCPKCQKIVESPEVRDTSEMSQKASGRSPWEVPHIKVTYQCCPDCAGVLAKVYPKVNPPFMPKREDFIGMSKAIPKEEGF